MKKIFLLLSLATFFFGCNPSVPETPLTTYSNSHYQFSLEFPENYSYCLNDYCMNTVPEEAITTFLLKDPNGATVASIQPYVNLLGMSAIDFGKRSLELNRANSQGLKDIYSNEGESSFAGENAFGFTATGGFEERGGQMGMDENRYIALIDNPNSTDPMISVALDGTYKTFYLDHGKHFFRISYLSDESTEKIMESFEFLE